ncbi:nuclear transport factor 2 family protein [Actinoplanes sp. NEAU-A12]|uniref:Nuclear transport factor 2 family protein n=1 Tax=Actinoplanes sandaracinus TaxID=3045177 RepID=A0ABT6WKE4_9ACTN|nr:nuclear transport factor 2 family protein [Actinoplanes sandaracinus]MDI6100130.1 nuclear transport factor 2 family protein [Actinoplanes sandaracinus]
MIDAGNVVERFNAAWEQGDLAAVTACLATDVTYSPSAWDGPAVTVHGREAVAAVFAGQLGPGDGPALGAVHVAGDRVGCEWQWPPAADGTTLRGLDVYLVRDGLIVAKDVFSKVVAR